MLASHSSALTVFEIFDRGTHRGHIFRVLLVGRVLGAPPVE
jgi:hypothetical protein